MPLQLLELGTVIPRFFYEAFLTKTPRDFAELNRPSMVNLGTVYPQALLIWTLGLTYSIIMPVILPFATLYFGLAYLVYKYRFLFVFCQSLSLSLSTLGFLFTSQLLTCQVLSLSIAPIGSSTIRPTL